MYNGFCQRHQHIGQKNAEPKPFSYKPEQMCTDDLHPLKTCCPAEIDALRES
jgi:hypothetical protein